MVFHGSGAKLGPVMVALYIVFCLIVLLCFSVSNMSYSGCQSKAFHCAMYP